MLKEKVVYEPVIENPCFVVGCSQNAAIYSDRDTAKIYYYPAENAEDYFNVGDVEERNALKALEYAPADLKAEIEEKLEEIEKLIDHEIDALYEKEEN